MKSKTNKWMIGIMVFAVLIILAGSLPVVMGQNFNGFLYSAFRTLVYTDPENPPDNGGDEDSSDNGGDEHQSPRDWEEWFMDNNFFKWLTANDFPGIGQLTSSLLGAGIGGYDEWLEEWQEDLGEFMCDSVVLGGPDCWVAEYCQENAVPENPESGGGTAMLPSGDIGAWITGKRTMEKNIPVLCNESNECPWGVNYGEAWRCRGGLCIDDSTEELIKVYMYTMTYYIKNPFDEITPHLAGVDYEDYEDHEPYNLTHYVSWTDDTGATGNFWTVEDRPTWSTIAEGEALSFYGSSATPIYSPRKFVEFCINFNPPYPSLPDDWDRGSSVSNTDNHIGMICVDIEELDPTYYSNPEAGADTPGAGAGAGDTPPPATTGGMV